MTVFAYGLCATRGQRSYQEDAAATWPGESTFGWTNALLPRSKDTFMAVLADGMGGHAGGARASQTACRAFFEACAVSREDPPELLRAGLNAANEQIAETVIVNPRLSGMGTTLVGTCFSDRGVEWVSVGDSPLYLLRRGEIALLNEDHSLAPALDRLAEEGAISRDEAKNDPRRHMLRSAITGEQIELVDVSREPLGLDQDDLVILASDGIHSLDQDEIVRVGNAYAADGPSAVAQALIRAVENQRDPFQDNTTVIVVQPAAS
jgi:PPM family protein phosphatase